jgi:enoyl-CoA hydratase
MTAGTGGEDHRAGRHAHLEVAGGVATLTIADAGPLNILSTRVIVGLTDALHTIGGDPAIRCLVLRGSGERAFVGGADVFEMAALDPRSAEAFIVRLRDLCNAITRFPRPVIARLPGWCLGGGLEVAMSCDLRICSRDARFGMPEVGVGIPSVIHAALMPRLIGTARASWMLLTGESIDAGRALDWGLVHEVAADTAALDARVAEVATRVAALPPAAVASQKALLRAWQDTTLEQAIDDSVAEFGRAYRSGEPQRAMGDFVARRARTRRS